MGLENGVPLRPSFTITEAQEGVNDTPPDTPKQAVMDQERQKTGLFREFKIPERPDNLPP